MYLYIVLSFEDLSLSETLLMVLLYNLQVCSMEQNLYIWSSFRKSWMSSETQIVLKTLTRGLMDLRSRE